MTVPAKKRSIVLLSLGLVLLAGLVWVPGRQAAERHVLEQTGGTPAPATCWSCHLYNSSDSVLRDLIEPAYLSPRHLAALPDGRLLVVAQDGHALLFLSPGQRSVDRRVPLGRQPHSVIVNRAGTRAYVTDHWENRVYVLDVASASIEDTLLTSAGPTGLALGPDETKLFVANSGTDDVSVFDLGSREEVSRFPAGNDPYAVRLSPDGSLLAVTNRLSNPIDTRDEPRTEITFVNAKSGRIEHRLELWNALMLEGAAFTPDGDALIVTLIRPKNLIPSTQTGRGWMITNGFAYIELANDWRTAQLLLDDVNAYFSDPYAVAISPDGKRAVVSHSGADVLSIIDLEAVRELLARTPDDSLYALGNDLGAGSLFVTDRVHTGSNPKDVLFSTDGSAIYVAERLSDAVGVFDAQSLKRTAAIDLGGPSRVSTLRLGARQFHGARAFQGQFSCRSCHPDLDQDGLAWDFAEPMGLGRNFVNSMTLRDIGETGPFKWAGTNVSLYMQDGIRFAKFLTRVDPFPPKELKALVAYLYAAPQPPNRYRNGKALTEAQARGKAIFERTVSNDGTEISPANRCVTCHPPPYFTTRTKFDVGTLKQTDKEIPFDTPQLVNVVDTAPYLHDGSARTLEEIWTRFNPYDQHGVANDMSKSQLNDLVEYLKTLGPPEEQD